MTEAETAAQAQLEILVQVVEMLGDFLRRIDRWLPPSLQELSREDSEGDEPDVTSQVRRIIQCVLADRIDPAIAELRAACRYRPAPAEGTKHVRRTKKDRTKKKADRLPGRRKA